jgi:Flp pilus assembly protein TadG
MTEDTTEQHFGKSGGAGPNDAAVAVTLTGSETTIIDWTATWGSNHEKVFTVTTQDANGATLRPYYAVYINGTAALQEGSDVSLSGSSTTRIVLTHYGKFVRLRGVKSGGSNASVKAWLDFRLP